MRVLAVYNIKGGVGKTTSAVNLAYRSAQAGARTLLWDLDPQGAASFYFRVEGRRGGGLKKLIDGRRSIERYVRATDYEGLDLLPADLSYRELERLLAEERKPTRRLGKIIRPLAKRYDHVYLDCAPSLSLVADGIFHAADALLVPSIPTTLSLRTLDQLAGYLARHGKPGLAVLPFYCMVDRRRALHRETLACREFRGFRFAEASIPYTSAIEQMGRRRAPLLAYAPGSPAAEAYEALWREALERTSSLMGWLDPLKRRLASWY